MTCAFFAPADDAASKHMSGPLIEKQVRIRRVTTISPQVAQGLADPARLRILEVLSQKPMTAEEIAKALGGAGMKKATTTVRHHLETLKKAGLVEASRMVEVRGAVMKYYSPTIRAYACEAQSVPDLDARAARIIADTGTKLARVLAGVQADKRFAALLEKEKEAGKCKEFLALEIMNAALARAISS